ncbi:conserved hypothetical protein [endosymbiont of unidentified scaly snail isolate Monju]|nr:conserved hypothetical protein [endosymbiont of unidentified scaly snail isolate Monju]
MNPEKVIFGFFIVLSLTLNFGFVLGGIDDPAHHHVYELFAVLLATSLVAIMQLFAAVLVWVMAVHVNGGG